MTYFCIIASVNYWNYFYDLLFTTIASFVFNAVDFFGVAVSPLLQKHVKEKNLINICFTVQFSCIALLIPNHFIGAH